MNMGIRYPESRIGRPREIGGRRVRKEQEVRREGGPEGQLGHDIPLPGRFLSVVRNGDGLRWQYPRPSTGQGQTAIRGLPIGSPRG